MKQIMANESTYKYQNVPTFEYNPHPDIYAGTLFPPQPLKDLENDLLIKLKGQTITVKEIYFQHNIGTKFIKSNYKQVLLKLEEEKKITANPSSDQRRRLTLGDDTQITFP